MGRIESGARDAGEGRTEAAVDRPGGRLEPLLRPRSIAVVGASATEGSFGHRLLEAVRGWGYPGRVYAVNPRYERLGDAACYPDLGSLPESVDLVAFAIAEARLEAAMIEAAQAGARAATVFSRGYVPPGAPRPSPLERWSAVAREAGLAVCGDNCMGFVNFRDRLQVSANPVPSDEPCGDIGLLSHSGSTWSGLVGNQRQLRFNYAVSIGREVATNLPQYMGFLLDQPETRVIALVLETVRDPEGFAAAAARALEMGVPVVALKLGRSERGRHFARSHSGALAGTEAAYRAYFEHHGVVEVRSLDELTDFLEMMRSDRVPPVGAVGIGTDSGGERQLLCDVAADVDLALAELGPATRERLEGILDPGLEPLNPVDYWGDGRVYFQECLEAIADDPGVGAVVMATNMCSGRSLLDITSANILALRDYTGKPVAKLGHLHSTIDRPAAARLREAGIPVLMGTVTGLSAVARFLQWHRRRGDVESAPAPPPADPALVARWERKLDAAEGPLPPADAMALLEAFDCPVTPWRVVRAEPEARAAGCELGFPVVLKSARADLLHKTDAGALVLDLATEAELGEAYRDLAARFGPEVLVQRQIPAGVELLLGIVSEPPLGSMVTVGLGGIHTEILGDVVTFVPPVGPERAAALLRRLRGYRLLEGVRGAARCDLEGLARTVSAFSRLAQALGPRIAEADVNPLIVDARGVHAVDALVLPHTASTRQGD